MGLRPARTIREPRGQIWARISQKKPRKSFVKGAPRPKVRQYDMGVDKRFELECMLVSDEHIHLRENAIEAARQITNKYLEKALLTGYYFKVLKYPHYVIREHSALGVAGADRISKGMKLAFGRPKGRMARLRKGDPLMCFRCYRAGLPAVREAARRGRLKLSGSYTLTVRDISKEAWNLAKSAEGKAFKKVEDIKPVAEAAAVPAAGAAAAGAEAGKPGEAAKAVAPAKEEKKK